MNKYEEAIARLKDDEYEGMYEDGRYVGNLEKDRDIYNLEALVERATPKKTIMLDDGGGFGDQILSCPHCKKSITNVWSVRAYEPNYCHYCGQKLDWRGDVDDHNFFVDGVNDISEDIKCAQNQCDYYKHEYFNVCENREELDKALDKACGLIAHFQRMAHLNKCLIDSNELMTPIEELHKRKEMYTYKDIASLMSIEKGEKR